MKYVWMLLLMLIPVSSQAIETVTVKVKGVVLNEKSHPIETQKKSLMAAQQAAVERAVGVYVQSHSKVSKSMLIESVIETEASGRIVSFDVLSHKVDGIYYTTVIKAKVSLTAVEVTSVNVETKLQTVSTKDMLGGLYYVTGQLPNNADLEEALSNPMPVIKAFFEKVKREAPHLNERHLTMSVAKQFGLSLEGTDFEDFSQLLNTSSLLIKSHN